MKARVTATGRPVKSSWQDKKKEAFKVRAPRKFRVIDQEGIHNLELDSARDYKRLRHVMKVENDRIPEYVPSQLNEYNLFIMKNRENQVVPLISTSQRILDPKKLELSTLQSKKRIGVLHLNKAIQGIVRHQDDFIKDNNTCLTDQFLNNHFRQQSLGRLNIDLTKNEDSARIKNYEELYAISEGSIFTGNNSQMISQRDLKGDSPMYGKQSYTARSRLQATNSTKSKEKSRMSYLINKSKPKLENLNNFERSAEMYSDQSRLRYFYQKVPEDLFGGQNFNDFYISIDQSLRNLLARERESRRHLLMTRSVSNTASGAEASTERDMKASLETLHEKIDKLKKVKQNTQEYFQIYYKVEKKKRLIENSVHALQVIDEQVDEYNRRMRKKLIHQHLTVGQEDRGSIQEKSVSNDDLMSSDESGSHLKPSKSQIELMSPASKKRNIVVRQVI